jgi:HSP20 family molecular chaperone IbpA
MQDLQRAVLGDFTRQMRALLDDFGGEGAGDGFTPPVDVLETGDAVTLRLEVPGFRHEDLTLEVDGRQLVVRGERPEPALPAGATAVHRERRFGHFERSFTLNFVVDRDRIGAECAHGVLTVRLPKAEPARARRIEVTAAS